MNTGKFDSMLESIRGEAASPAQVDQAASRVRAKLFAAAPAPASASLRSCADFREIIPSYLNRSLSPAKSLLLVDHTHECVACRQALETARSGNVRMLRRPEAISSQVSPWTRWAAAAVVVLAAGLGTWAAVRSFSTPAGARATVQRVDGSLYRIANRTSQAVFTGRELGEREAVRTPKASFAVLRLTDGSTMEMNERTEASVSRAAGRFTIRLEHGNIIVHAAKQGTGALYVKTNDCEVAVKGTIFAVSSGTKGTRVSVVEGSVKVDQSGQSRMLKPGEQATTSALLEKTAVQDEIGWSRDATQYLAILGELSGFQKDLERLPPPAIRTSSKLLDLAPPNTILYAAIPNIGNTAAQAYAMFQERVQSNQILRDWWSQQESQGARLREMVDKIQTMSSYLGDEVVLAVSAGADGRPSEPMLLAESKREGLREVIQNEIAAVNARSGRVTLEMADNPALLRSTDVRTAKVYLANGIVALSPNPAQLQDLAARMQPGASAERFADTGFHQRIQQAYTEGAAWLFCADLEQMRGTGNRFDRKRERAAANATGFSGVRYLVLERKDLNGQTHNQATLSFNGQRRGLAAWLAAPGPMSTLEFVSPDASVAFSAVIDNPGALLSQFLAQAEAGDPGLEQKINELQAQTGVNLIGDVANALGGELTFAIDGPLLPVPSWKVAVEAVNPDRLEWAFERLVNAANQQATNGVTLKLTQSQQNGRTYYQLLPSGPNVPAGAEVDYVFVDGYLLAAANRALLDSAIQNRSTGYTLSRSEKFRAVLPQDANSNFSAIVYHNARGLVGPLADGLKSMNVANPQQQAALDALKANSAPGLIYAYGQPDKIVISANGSLFGFSLDTLALPKVIENVMRQKHQ